MTDYISREAAIDLLKRLRKDGDMIPWEGKKVFHSIRNLPAADVRPVRHGRWVTREVLVNPIDGIWRTLVECSECGGEAFKHEAYGYQRDNFCHLCGADMREEEK